MRIYTSVDFEAVNAKGDWWACGIVVAEYPSRRVLFSETYTCPRSRGEFDPVTLNFWQEHPNAFRFLRHLETKTSVVDAEILFCSELMRLIHRFPKFFLLSDNPQFDIALLDQILLRGKLPKIAQRCPDKYLHTTCTRSFQQAVRLMRSDHTAAPLSHLDLEARQKSALHELARGTKHTPVCDAANILLSHFQILDFLYKR